MTGQLSDDGNFMWNGNEWVPVEQQAAPAAPMAAAEPMAAAAPMVVSPHTDTVSYTQLTLPTKA